MLKPQPEVCAFLVEMAVRFDLPFRDEAHYEDDPRFTRSRDA